MYKKDKEKFKKIQFFLDLCSYVSSDNKELKTT